MIAFIEEFIHIFLMVSPYILLGIVFVVILDLFVSKEFVLKNVGRNNFASIVKTAILGIPLPLCSCGVIPTSVYLAKSGASKPSVVSFLISTPQTGVDSIVATYWLLGPVFAVFRPLAALAMGIIGGVATMLFEKRNDNSKINFSIKEYRQEYKPEYTFPKRVLKSLKFGFVDFIDDIVLQFIIGILVSALISFFVPDDFFADTVVSDNILGMVVIILFSIPMYVCATASIPVAITLMMKGLSPGVAYVFLVSGPVTNAASIAILSRVFDKKTITIYIATVFIASIAFGSFLNWIFEYFQIDPHSSMKHFHSGHEHFSAWEIVFGFIFFIIIFASLWRKYSPKLFRKQFREVKMSENIKRIKIEGMTCNHCAMNVEKAIGKISGVEDVKVDLANSVAIVKGNFNLDEVKNTVDGIGYKFIGEIN